MRRNDKVVLKPRLALRLLFLFGLVLLIVGALYLLVDGSRVYGYGITDKESVISVDESSKSSLLGNGMEVALSERFVFTPYSSSEGYISELELFTVPVTIHVILVRSFLFYLGFILICLSKKFRVVISVISTLFMYLIGLLYFDCSYALILPLIVILVSMVISMLTKVKTKTNKR